MTFHSLSIFCRGRALSLYSTSHLATQARTPSLTVPFWTISKIYQGMYLLKNLYQASSSIYIDLDAQCVSSFTKVFLWKTFIQVSFHALQNNSTLFPINNMSFTYTYQKCCSAPTHFLVNTGFTASLYKTMGFYFYAPGSLALLIHPHSVNFCLLFPTPLPETLRTGYNGRCRRVNAFDR